MNNTLVIFLLSLILGIFIGRFFNNETFKELINNLMNRENVAIIASQTSNNTEVEWYTLPYGVSELYNIVSSFKLNPIILNYRELLDVDLLYTKSKLDHEELEKKIFDIVKKYLKKNNIHKVIIPGDTYNIQHEPFHPTPNRELLTNVLTKMAQANDIHFNGNMRRITGICALSRHKIRYSIQLNRRAIISCSRRLASSSSVC